VLHGIAESVDPSGRSVVCSVTDITSKPDVERLVATTVKRFGRVDSVVQCAAYTTPGGISDPCWDRMREVFDVNVLGMLQLVAAAVEPFLSEEGR
jgi:D-sorbitol dehydrogenase (acceptor)